jgi:hypothetical protein
MRSLQKSKQEKLIKKHVLSDGVVNPDQGRSKKFKPDPSGSGSKLNFK